MSQLSQRLLSPPIEAKIHNLLIKCIVQTADPQAAANFIDVLVTRTEKTMIAKRIAIALMLIKGHTAHDIDEKLKVSVATVYTVKAWLESRGKEYYSLLEHLAKEDEQQEKAHQDAIDDAQSFFTLTPHTNWKGQRQATSISG